MNQERLVAWLKDHPREVATAIALRAALRVAPTIALFDRPLKNDYLVALFRCLLTAGLAASLGADLRFNNAAEIAYRAVSKYPEAFGARAAVYACFSASNRDNLENASSAVQMAARAELKLREFEVRMGLPETTYSTAKARQEARVTRERATAHEGFTDAMNQDLAFLASAPRSINIFSQRLWIGGKPHFFDERIKGFVETLSEKPDLEFWARWYQGLVDGQPMNWEMQREIVLIEDEVWRAGAAAVAKKIAEIEARYKLKSRFEEVQLPPKELAVSRHGIGGNNPPEDIGNDASSEQVVQIIWTDLEHLKEEVEAEEPSPSRLKQIIASLGGALKVITAWCGGKLDKGAEEFIKAIGKYGGGAAALWLAANTEAFQGILKAAEAWLKTLG